MDLQKVKSLLLFLVLTGLFFYFGHSVARESDSAVVQSEQSMRFLDAIAVLDSIQFDFDFINSLGDTAIKTEVYVPPVPPSDSKGRDNPFMRSDSSPFFSGSSGISTGADVFNASEDVRERVFELPSTSIVQQPLSGAVPPQDPSPVFSEDSTPERQEDRPVSPPTPSSSATLTR